MKLKLQNILKVKSADIELGGLTVITGENDSGKSSIGKVLFTVLKAANKGRLINREGTIRSINLNLRSIGKMFVHNGNLSLLDDIQGTSAHLVDQKIPLGDFVALVKNEAQKSGFSVRKLAILNNRLANIKQLISDLKNPEMAVKRAFDIIAKSEFMEPLNSHGTSQSLIHFFDDTTDADGSYVSVTLERGKVEDIRLWGFSSIEDVTYIESPVYLHILDILRMPDSVSTGIFSDRHKGGVPYHLSDMAEKVLNSSENLMDLFEESCDFQSQMDEISEIIEGDFTVDTEARQLFFEREGFTMPTVSVASGIKSFGMLMRLIKSKSISTFKMLVLDEPEIHLHPEWQIQFCKLIVELVAQGVPIVVSSHSPYFIQGLRYFSAARGIENDVSYYMAEPDAESGLSTLKNVTDDLNKVFTLLAAPLQEIMNVDAVRLRKK